MYPALLPLMRTPPLPVVGWTDAPAGLNGLVRFAERPNLFSARVPSHFKRSLPCLATLFPSFIVTNTLHLFILMTFIFTHFFQIPTGVLNNRIHPFLSGYRVFFARVISAGAWRWLLTPHAEAKNAWSCAATSPNVIMLLNLAERGHRLILLFKLSVCGCTWQNTLKYVSLHNRVANMVFGQLADPFRCHTYRSLCNGLPCLLCLLVCSFFIMLHNVMKHSVYTLQPLSSVFLYFVQNLVYIEFPLIISYVYRARYIGFVRSVPTQTTVIQGTHLVTLFCCNLWYVLFLQLLQSLCFCLCILSWGLQGLQHMWVNSIETSVFFALIITTNDVRSWQTGVTTYCNIKRPVLRREIPSRTDKAYFPVVSVSSYENLLLSCLFRFIFFSWSCWEFIPINVLKP